MTTVVRKVRAADFYRFAREELHRARVCVLMLNGLALLEHEEGALEFAEEVHREGSELLVESLVRADGWRALARRARAEGL